ncbi:6-phosphogluconolactonase [Nocardioides sp. AE5]|uniref:6-phosphogluconolactonase n=1 Tax=Nocardioides sp. AE5 TaxID=2962573 RepID=UPI002880C8B4|nr:6-phosphogluconolactonase [Nocardioides sp. AE5]MDT0203639.1 6-phosphogluconolactonase [Nocardioides sp. AE5]
MSEHLQVHPDAATLAEAVAEALVARLVEIQAEGRTPVVGLTGGTIAAAVHRRLASSMNGLDVDWDDVDFWWGDERYVAADSEDRNAGAAREDFLEPVEADLTRIHEMPAVDSGLSLTEAAAAYATELREFGGGTFDVLFLGIGPDGHVASLFPHSTAVTTAGAVTVAVPDSPKPPAERITLTLEALGRSDQVWFVASGQEKAQAVARALSAGPVEAVPARGVRGLTSTTWWLDAAAASALE